MTQYIIHRDNELIHYGVPGTKWGIRRYQNKDGSYKPGAEGRYYTPVGKIARNTLQVKATKQVEKARSTAERFKSLISSNKSNNTSSGGGSTSDKKNEKPIDKTVLGKDINVKDASEKLDTSKDSTKKSSSKKSSSSSSETSSFKISQLTDKIENLFDMDDMTDEDWEKMELSESDISEIDNLITQYRAWRSGNKSNTKKLKKIDEFIERYTAWKSSYTKHMEPRELYIMHWGVPGMKWGIRRYQNKDGSYKPGAEGRYAPDKSSRSSEKTKSEDYVRSRSKSTEEMSDDELRIAVNRLNNERQYKMYKKELDKDEETKSETDNKNLSKKERKRLEKEADKEAEKKRKEEKKEFDKLLKKGPSNLTNEELQKVIDRLNKEKNLKQLREEQRSPTEKALRKTVDSIAEVWRDALISEIKNSASRRANKAANDLQNEFDSIKVDKMKIQNGLDQIKKARERLKK